MTRITLVAGHSAHIFHGVARSVLFDLGDFLDDYAVDRELRNVFNKTPFEQVVIRVAPNLHYEELMKVIDVCARQKLPNGQNVNKISFVEMSPFEGSK